MAQWGEYHPLLSFPVGGQQAPPEPTVLASLETVSIHLISACLLGTPQSGHVSENLDQFLRGLERGFETRIKIFLA